DAGSELDAPAQARLDRGKAREGEERGIKGCAELKSAVPTAELALDLRFDAPHRGRNRVGELIARGRGFSESLRFLHDIDRQRGRRRFGVGDQREHADPLALRERLFVYREFVHLVDVEHAVVSANDDGVPSHALQRADCPALVLWRVRRYWLWGG